MSEETESEEEYIYKEPQIHSHITDILPEDHPLAYKSVYCKICTYKLHNFNNECMSTWIETGKGNYCIKCFIELDPIDMHRSLEDEYALKEKIELKNE